MSRRTERAILGAMGFAGAVLALVVGAELLAGGGSVDVTADSVGGVEAIAAAAPSGEVAESGVGATPDSLVVSTTAPSNILSTTAVAVDTSTTALIDSTASSPVEAEGGDSTTTSTTSETAVSSGDASSTESTLAPSTSSTSSTSSTAIGSSSTVVPDTELSDIEREIIRLTNELRTNPAGPERRLKPMPGCVDEDDQIEIDPATGHPRPARRLTPSRPVSIRMARDWSQQMADADAMSHRSADSQSALYGELGIDWAARGENVAWAVGYDLADVAALFFRGWRESDGHYCNMMSGAFSEIGVGHVRTDAGKDFATQNFYRPR